MEPRHAPILAVIPPPAQYAMTFFAGAGLDRLIPWRPVWLTMGEVHCLLIRLLDKAIKFCHCRNHGHSRLPHFAS
jgi:hypothetical protein